MKEKIRVRGRKEGRNENQEVGRLKEKKMWLEGGKIEKTRGRKDKRRKR